MHTRPTCVFALFLALSLTPRLAAQDIPEGSARAVSEFAQGLELYNAQDYADALPHLYRAYELDNSFVVSLFHAALCESNLGSDVPGDSLLEIVLQNRDRLSPYYVHRAEGYLAKLSGDRELGIEHTRKAAHLAPGTKAWYNLAYDLLPMNRPREARDALMQLDPEKEPMTGWYGYYGVLANANHLVGSHEEELAATQKAREKHPERRAAFIRQAEALAALGQLEALDRLFEDAAAGTATGAANTVGAIMVVAAAELKVHGNENAGDQIYLRAIEWYQNAGETVAAPVHQTWNTLALFGAGRFGEVLENCERHLADQPDYLWYHGMTGLAAFRAGDQERAAEEVAYYEQLAPERPARFLPFNMAYFAAVQGNAEETVSLLEEAMALGSAFSMWTHRDPAFDLVRDHPAFQEFLRPKG